MNQHFLRHLAAATIVGVLAVNAASSAISQDSGTGDSDSAPLEERGYALGDIILGSKDAPVTVIEYYSPTCPHCATFHENAFPQLKSEYIDTGKVRFIFRAVYFDQVGLLAGRVARCGGPGPYHDLVDVILGSMHEWGRDSDPAKAMVQLVLRTGFPTARLRECLLDREYGIRLVDIAMANMDSDEIQSTPTFIIGTEIVRGAVPFEEIAAVIEDAMR